MIVSHRWHRVIILLVLVLVLLVSGLPGRAIGDGLDPNTKIIITSRFVLWDSTEKMIDPIFTIHMFYFNITNNHTAFYVIRINENTYPGIFQVNKSIDFNINYTDVILLIQVDINNETVLSASNIYVTDGITQGGIRRIREPFGITLTPWEWSAKEWNIFFGIFSASLLSILVGYRMVTKYRKHRGVIEIK